MKTIAIGGSEAGRDQFVFVACMFIDSPLTFLPLCRTCGRTKALLPCELFITDVHVYLISDGSLV